MSQQLPGGLGTGKCLVLMNASYAKHGPSESIGTCTPSSVNAPTIVHLQEAERETRITLACEVRPMSEPPAQFRMAAGTCQIRTQLRKITRDCTQRSACSWKAP